MDIVDKLAVALVLYALAVTFGFGYYKGRNTR